ncbi:MAG: mechanosensitive ion channel family protein [Verrucomicrobiales bacterium]
MEGRAFTLGDLLLFSVLENDLDPDTGQDLDEAATDISSRLEDLMLAKRSQRNPGILARGLLVSILATCFLIGLIWLLLRLRQLGRKAVLRRTAKARKLKLERLDLRITILKVVRFLINALVLIIGLSAMAYWARVVLSQFPYTAPWGGFLKEQLQALAGSLVQGTIKALPGLLLVIIIFCLTRGSARVVDGIMKSFETSNSDDSWFSGDSARATRRVTVVLVWVAGLVIAYPYIPGSDSPAFRGIGVMAGLMISLGSSGVVNQVMSGFVALYSGAVRSGEYAKIGEVEGTVTEVGFLATKVLTPKQEYVTVPNSVLVGDNTINYSRLGAEEATLISTEVTIGYDTPWRQVHAMLLLAAERTKRIRRDPSPSIRQTDLSDFYVEYSLRFVPEKIEDKNRILSDLRQKILDVFNEFGVQITSPNYVAEPPEAHVIAKEDWAPPPAEPEQ